MMISIHKILGLGRDCGGLSLCLGGRPLHLNVVLLTAAYHTKDFFIQLLLEIGVLLGALYRLSTLHSSICSNIDIKKGFVIIMVVKHK